MGQIRPLYNVRSVISRAAQGFCVLASVALALFAAHCAHAALPSGYVQLKSITSTGSQYIQTGMLPSTSTTVEMDFNTGPNGTDTMFFGQAWNASQYLFCKKSDKYAFYGSGGQVSPLNPNTDAHVSITAENKFIIDYGSVAYTSTVSRAVSSSKFNIFADCDGGHKGSWTLYSLKIWNGGTAMRDFVPALRESDNAVGLYDVVGNTFYANSGSGAFISDKSLYHIANASMESGNASSLSGDLNGSTPPTGWADSSNSTTRIRDGITGAYEKYYFWCTNRTGTIHQLRTRSFSNGSSYATPATSEIIFLPNSYVYMFNKSCGTSQTDGSVATLTFNNTTLLEGSCLDFRCNQNGRYTYVTQVGGSFDVKEDAALKFTSFGGSGTSDTPCGVVKLTATVTGKGTIESKLLNNSTAVASQLNQSITGDLSGFTGDLVVYRANLTYPGDLIHELVNANSIPADPAPGETAYVVVTNSAVLQVDHNWDSGVNRIWNFGDSGVPTINVAAGKTVTIRGELLGSIGFNKTGSGTLVLAHPRAQEVTLSGTATFTAAQLAAYQADCSSDYTVSPIPLQTIAFGESATPDVVVSNGSTGAVLVKDTDYTLSYENNDFTGNATVTITGINDYEGLIDRTVSFRVFTSFDDGTPVLPAGYTAVDCFYVNNSSLTTTGSGAYSWIDTGVFPKGDWTISIDFAVGSIYKGDTWNLMCSRNGASDDTGRLVCWAAVSGVENSEMAGHPRIDLGNVNTTASGINCYEWVGRHSFQYHRGTAYLDVDAVATAATTNFTASGRTVLFASYASSTAAPNGNAFSGAFYGAKFYDGAGTLQMHLVPCVRESDGAVGVYNLGATSPGFMANSGTVPFTLDAPGRELLVNGGFETRTALDTGNYGYIPNAYGNRQARTSAWFGSGAISTANGDYNVPSSFPTGTYCAPMGGNNLSQTFLCDRPVKAQLSFKYMHRQTWNPGVAVDLIVSLDGVQLDQFAVPVNSSTIYNYAKADIFLPYSPEGHTLRFSRSGSGEYYLDNISLKVTDVYQSNEFVCQLPGESFPATRLAPAEPSVIVSNVVDGVQLVAGTDYEVAYSNDYAHGRGYATVTGRGDYAGLKDTLAYKIVYRFDSDDFETNLSIRPADGMVTTTLANFPVLVRLSATRQPGFDPADCGEGGANLRFMLADGTMLAHEIDWWDPEGESTVWVNVPSLTADTTIYALWGPKGGYTPPVCPASETWPDYVGVWHMSEAAATLYDSSGNGYTATNLSPDTVTAAANPVVGRAVFATNAFMTAVTDLLAASAAKPISNRSKVTFSGWLSIDSAARSDKGSTFAIYNKFVGWNDNTGGGCVSYLPDYVNDSSYKSAIIQVFLNSGTGYSGTIVNTYPNASKIASRRNAWMYLAVSLDGTTKAYYVDGSQTGTETVTHGLLGPDNTRRLSFGVNNKTSGRGDEIRIRNGVASAAWILADYRNQATDGFLVYGTIGKKTFSVPAIAGVTVSGVGATAVPVVAPVDDITGDALTEGVDYTLELEDNTFGNITGKAIVTGIGGYAGCITNTFEILGIVSTNLVGDADWTAYSNPRISSSATVDLKGYALRVSALYAGGTVTDSVGGGQLIFDVPAGRTVTLNTALTGALKLVKTGAGVLSAVYYPQTYTGGTDVLGGVLRYGRSEKNINSTDKQSCFGAYGYMKIYVGPDGVLDPAGSYLWGYHSVVLDGGSFSNTVANGDTGNSNGFNANIAVTGDVAIVTMQNYRFNNRTIDLQGGTMTIENYNSCTLDWGMLLQNGTLEFKRGGWFNVYRAMDMSTCDFRQTGGALNVANALSVRDYYCSYSSDYANGSAALNVYGTFTPASTYFYGPTMQNGSAIDLSAKSGAWSTTSPNNGHHSGNKTVKFAANATVAIGLGERELAAGDRVVAWTSEPSTVVFTNADWYLVRRTDGVYVAGTQASGAPVLPVVVPVQYIRSGVPATPALALVNAATGADLVAGTDYDVAYSDNTAPGTATLTVTGKGDYAGLSFTDQFTIANSFAASAAVPPAAYMDGTLDWTGVAVTDVVTGGALVEGTDYYYDYTLSGSTATVTITGAGYYAGTTLVYTFEIAPRAYFTDFRSKIEITVGEGMVTTELANFPALVRLSAAAIDGFNPADCGEGGSELAFILEDGGEMLPCEVDYWNPEGESTVWVKVPSLAADTKLYAVYGRKDGRVAIASSPKRVWGDYVGVWHMSEADGAVADSTGHGLNATPAGSHSAADCIAMTGVGEPAGACRRLASAKDRVSYLSVPNYNSFGLGNSFVISGWLKATAVYQGYYERPFSRKNNYQDNNGFETQLHAASEADAKTKMTVRGSGTTGSQVSFPDLTANWLSIVLVFNGSTVRPYVNGAAASAISISAASDNGLRLSIGNNSNGSEKNFYGYVDEVRLADGSLSADRIAADYKTMTEANFFEYGAVEPTGLPVYFAPIPAQRIRGAAVEPLVALTNTDTKAELVLGTDYTVAYENNASNGTGRAVVTGKGDYAGYTDARTFEILPAFEVSIPTQMVGPDGKIPWQSGWVTDAETGAELSDGVDYSHTYEIVQSGDAYVGRAVVTGLGGYAVATVTNDFAAKMVLLVGGYTVAEEGTGVTWDSPVSLGRAITMFNAAPDNYSEIWMMSGVYTLTAELIWSFTAGELAIRGGFAGTENDPSERDPAARTEFYAGGSRSATSGSASRRCCDLVNTVPVTIDGVNFTCGYYGLTKTGAGRLTLVNSGMLNNYYANDNTSEADNPVGSNPESGKFRVMGDSGCNHGCGLRIQAAGADIVVSNCVIAGNLAQASYQNGAAGLLVWNVKSLSVTDTLIASNGLHWSRSSAPGNNHRGRGTAIWLYNAPATFERCRILGHWNGTTGGVDTDGGRACNIFIHGSSGGTRFDHCAIAGNMITAGNSVAEGSNSYAGNMLVDLSTAAATVEFDHCTVAYNFSMKSKAACALSVYRGTMVIRNSIFAHNLRGNSSSVGSDLHLLTSSAFAEVYHTLFTADATTSVSAYTPANLTIGSGVLYGDPLLATSLATVNGWKDSYRFTAANLSKLVAMNLHPLSKAGYVGDDGVWTQSEDQHSPAIDTGDLSDPVGAEPEPNGGVVNLGAYGGTAEASKSDSYELAVSDVAIAFDGDYSQPTVSFTVGGSGSFTASAEILWSTNGTGWVFGTTLNGLTLGDTPSYALPLYVPPGSMWARVTLHTGKVTSDPADSGETPVTKPLPPWYGKKGPANVVHVRAGAIGAGDGTSWSDAFTTLRAAFEATSAEKNEIWIATNTISLATVEMDAAVSVGNALTVRGGFKGWEETADERPEGAVSTVDGVNRSVCLNLNNSAAVTVERMRFYRAKGHGFQKGGAGDITLVDCQFANTSTSGDANGRGLYVSGTAGTTRLTATRCEFTDNIVTSGYGSGSMGNGCGAWIQNLARAVFDDCLFAGNGNVDRTGGWTYGPVAGAAIYVNAVPVTMRGCRILANTGNTATQDGGGGHQTTYFGVMRFQGDCSGSAMTNCVVAGNAVNTSAHSSGESDNHDSGAIVVAMGAADRTLDIVNCTIAYNIGNGVNSPGGVNVLSGDVTMKNSIVYGNWRWNGTDSNTRHAADVDVKAGASFAADWSLFTADSTNSVDGASGAAITLGDGVVYGDPLFVTLLSDVSPNQSAGTGRAFIANSTTKAFRKAINVHLRGARGYFDETTGELVADYMTKETVSPAQDAGDPRSDYRGEPDANDGWHGRRVNMGAWGNTPWATRTKFVGGVVRVR